jgi:hypothetical protein
MEKINRAMAKLKIGQLNSHNLWMETFPSREALLVEVLLRAKLEHLYGYPKFHKVYHGSINFLTLDQIEAWFNGKSGYDSSMSYANNEQWILITKEGL